MWEKKLFSKVFAMRTEKPFFQPLKECIFLGGMTEFKPLLKPLTFRLQTGRAD
jgi:hypothetical protein